MADGICENHHQEKINKSPIGLVRKAVNLGSNAIHKASRQSGCSATDSRVNQMLADGDADGDGEVTLVRIAHLLRAVFTRERDRGQEKR